MSHQIEVSDIVGGVKTIELASSIGRGEHKRLGIEIKILANGELISEYIVENRRETVYKTQNVERAVDFYNNL